MSAQSSVRIPLLLACGAAIALVAGLAQSSLPPLRVAGNMTTIELSPVLVAANGIYPGPITVSNGGILNIMNGEVDAATKTLRTQLLRQSVDDPGLRIIFTVAESFYRIVARRSAGHPEGRRISKVNGSRRPTTRRHITIW